MTTTLQTRASFLDELREAARLHPEGPDYVILSSGWLTAEDVPLRDLPPRARIEYEDLRAWVRVFLDLSSDAAEAEVRLEFLADFDSPAPDESGGRAASAILVHAALLELATALEEEESGPIEGIHFPTDDHTSLGVRLRRPVTGTLKDAIRHAGSVACALMRRAGAVAASTRVEVRHLARQMARD